MDIWNRTRFFSSFLSVRAGTEVVVAEWLRRWTRNPLGSPRVGSNPADYGVTSFLVVGSQRNLSSQKVL